MTIKAILFDLDDTLLWDHRSVTEAFQATCKEATRFYQGLDPIELEAAVRNNARNLYESFETFAFTQMIGINPFEALWANFTSGENENFRKLNQLAPQYRTESWVRGLHSMGIDDRALGAKLAEQFPDERRARPYVYEETFDVLDLLKGNYKLLLLTNGSPDLQHEKISGVPKLADYFDHIIVSGSFGEGKPATSIFQHAMELLAIEPSEGIMVGDKLTTDILGSNRIGMPNAWLNRDRLARTDEIVPQFEISNLNELHSVIEQCS